MWVSLLALPAGAAAPPQSPSAATGPCRVYGAVVDSQSRAGVSGAAVILRGPAGGGSGPDQSARSCSGGCETAADADGRFAFEGLAPGPYTVAASVAGFSESAPAPVTLALAGTACASIVEIPFRFQIRAESKAEIPRAPEAT